MTNREISVGLRITGDNKDGLEAVSGLRKELSGLKADGEKVKLLDGESQKAEELAGELARLQQETNDLAAASTRVRILESALASVDNYRAGITAAEAKVRQLQATLSEAYNAGADKSLIGNLERQLAAAERAADQANTAFAQGTANLVKLNLEAGKTGITTSNLAAKKAELAAETGRLSQAIESQSAAIRLEAQYQAHLADESERLAAAEKRIAEGARFEQRRQTAIQAQKAAEYTGWWAAELEKVEQRERAAAAAADRLSNAFKTLEIRSAKQIHADIQEVNRSLLALAQRADISGDEFDRAFAAGQKRIEQLRAELRGVPGEVGQVAKSADMLSGVMGRLAAAYGGLELAREFIKANVAMESMQRTLLQLTGSGDAAAAEIDYLRQTANRLGLEVRTASQAYMTLFASAKGTAMEGQKTREVFEAVAGAMAKLGKSSSDTEGALQAVSQMMGKGVVSMEEMRQQLAERLPGAMQATADAMGVSVAELNDMIATGQVLAEDLLPKLAEGLKKMYGVGAESATGAISSWSRLKNAVNDTFVFIGNSGVMAALVLILDQAAVAVRGLTGAFELLGKIFGITAAAIWTFDWKHPIESIKNWKEAVKEAGDDIQKRLDQVKASSEQTGAAQAKMADAGQRAAAGAAQHAASWLAVQNAYAKVAKAAEENTRQAEKSAEAREAEGKAARELSAAFGTESEKRIANLAAARADAAALADVAAARDREAKIAQSQVAALQEAAAAEGKVSDAKKKAIQEATDAAKVKQEEADKAVAAALAAQQHAAALAVESAAVQDNAARVNELRAAHEQAQGALIATQAAHQAGNATLAEVQSAMIAAGQAAALYRDALHDVTESIQRKADAGRAANSLEQANTTLALEQIRTSMALAKAKGDEAGYIRLKNEASRLEAELSRLKAEALRLEAAAQLEVVKAKRAELEASGQLTPAKQAELAAQEAGAKVKKVEAEIADEVARRTRELADATWRAGDAAKEMGGGFKDAANDLDNMAGAAERAGRSLSTLRSQRAAASQENDGVVDRDVSTQSIDHRRLAAQYGLVGEAAAEFSQLLEVQMAKEMGQLQDKFRGMGANETMGVETYRLYYSGAMQRAVDSAVSQTRGWQSTQGSRSTVEIKLPGGRGGAVDMASQEDADALSAILRQLESAASRSSLI